MAAAACASLLTLAAMASPAGATGRAPTVVPPKAYYLSLGDSMGFGLQFDKLDLLLEAGAYSPDAFDTGYTDVLGARMRQLRPGQQTANFSCPGETTATMVEGGCFFTNPEPEGAGLTLHLPYPGSQLDAAVWFLKAHPGQVSPVTVSIGGIDAADVIGDQCGGDAACVEQSGLRDNLARGLDRILGTLRQAAPDTEIVLVALHNPFTVDHPETDALWRRTYTKVERAAARRNGARFSDFSKIVERGDACQLTFLCGSGDSHPTDEGYRRIAGQVFRVAGYERLVRCGRK
jgi:lysophospholipase L1-like esterase